MAFPIRPRKSSPPLRYETILILAVRDEYIPLGLTMEVDGQVDGAGPIQVCSNLAPSSGEGVRQCTIDALSPFEGNEAQPPWRIMPRLRAVQLFDLEFWTAEPSTGPA